jgi:hypothetical protein
VSVASRRQFIQSGLALSAVSLTGIPTFTTRADEFDVPSCRIERFVFDTRFAAAVALARHAARHGVTLAETSGDLGDLWYNDLDLRWKQAPMALAGMTTRGGLFILETLAADHRMLVVYRGTHEASQEGGVRHVLSGPAPLVSRATAHSAAPFWERLGRAMHQCPPDGRRVTECTLTTSAEEMSASEPLFSWVIAPRSPRATAV